MPTTSLPDLGRRAKAAARLLATALLVGEGRGARAWPPIACRIGPTRSWARTPSDVARSRGRPARRRRWSTGSGFTEARVAAMAGGLRVGGGAARSRRRGRRRLRAAERASRRAGPRPARRRRDHLREPPERHRRRGRAVPEVGQRGVAAGLGGSSRVQPRHRLVACDRRSRRPGLPGRRRRARRGHRRTRRLWSSSGCAASSTA